MKTKKIAMCIVLLVTVALVISSISLILGSNLSKATPDDTTTVIIKTDENIENYGIKPEITYDSFVTADLNSNSIEKLRAMGFTVYEPEDINNIKLRYKEFDVKNGAPDIPENLKIDEYPMDYKGARIVKFKGPVKEEWKTELKHMGVEIDGYLPENSFMVKMDGFTAEEVTNLDYVQWIGIHQPAYKIQPRLLNINGLVDVEVITERPVYAWSVAKVIMDNNGIIRDVAKTSDRGIVKATIDSSMIDLLAMNNRVKWIDRTMLPELHNAGAQDIVQTGVDGGGTPIWGHGIEGAGQIVGYSDTGLDYDHNLFRDPDGPDPRQNPNHRKIARYMTTAVNKADVGWYVDSQPDDADGCNSLPPSGHGSHVGGTIAGNDDYVSGGSGNDGMAPQAKLYFDDVGIVMEGTDGYYHDSLSGIPGDYEDMWQPAYDDNVRVYSHSWGRNFTFSYYTNGARMADKFMWEHKEMLLLFSNGNDGAEGANSVGSPASAKNIISVGASGNDGNYENVADFSSLGPTDDGRIKPTLVAPGQTLDSAAADDGANAPGDHYADNTTNQADETGMQGTSMSCPATAGSAALVREYFTDGFYPSGTEINSDGFEPSAALLKAMLVNGAYEITGTNSDKLGEGVYPNNAQGWGQMNLENSMYFDGDTRKTKVVEHPGLMTGESASYEFYVSDNSEAFEATLVWTDYPGEVESSQPLVNNLDLDVTDPGSNNYKGNVFSGINPGQSATGGSYDNENPVEGVLRLNPSTGTYTVNIDAANVPNGRVQPFSLVVTGGLDTSYGTISLNETRYHEHDTVEITVEDTGQSGSVDVDVTSTTETTAETVSLAETDTGSGRFVGTIQTNYAAPSANGMIEVSDGDTLTASYADPSPSHTATATATIDASPPMISNVFADNIANTAAKINWDTDETSDSTVYYGTSSDAGTWTNSESLTELTQVHGVTLRGLSPQQTYYYDVESTDWAGHTTRADNNGNHYTFTTSTNPVVLCVVDEDVPSDADMYIKDYELSLEHYGWTYVSWDTTDLGIPSTSDLENAQVVMWDTAQGYPQLGSTERSQIGPYLQQADSRFFAIGQDIGWDMSNDGTDSDEQWYNDYLLSIFRQDDADGGGGDGTIDVIGQSGDPISGAYTGGITLDQSVFGSTRFWPDDITNDYGTMCWDYSTHAGGGDAAGIRADSSQTSGGGRPGQHRLVYEAWAHQMMGDTTWPPSTYDATRADIVDKSVSWLLGNNHPTVTLSAPTGGETWSGTNSITWSKDDPDADNVYVDIYISDDSGQTWVQESSGETGTSYSWDTTTVENGDTYRVKLYAYDDGTPSLNDVDSSASDFTVDNGDSGDNTGPAIWAGSVDTTPDPVDSGSVITITATADDSSNGDSNIQAAEYYIDRVPDGSPDGTMSATDGTFDEVTEDITADHTVSSSSGEHTLYVRAQDTANNWGDYETCTFEVLGGSSNPPSITITAPNGGESWEQGTTQTITWTTTTGDGTITGVDLEYSTDNGGSWTTIVTGTNDDGSHDWSVPFEPSDQCLVRGTVHDDQPASGTDTSDATFTIDYNTHALGTLSSSDGGGWNFVSFNLDANGDNYAVANDLVEILEDTEYGIPGSYDKVMYYSAADDDWKTYVPGRSTQYNDLSTWNTQMGLWIHMTVDDSLTVEGTRQSTTDITLYPGWNMVSYPSSESGTDVPDDVSTVGYYDGAAEYNLAYDQTPGDMTLNPGEAYWFYYTGTSSWTWTVTY